MAMNRTKKVYAFFLLLGVLIISIGAGPLPSIVITEILKDPRGAETTSPGGASHEFIEITNFSSDTFHFVNTFLSDGMEHDSIIAWTENTHPEAIFNSLALAPGATACILDPDYRDIIKSERYQITPGTLLLTVADSDLGNGISTTDGFVLYRHSADTPFSVIASIADAGQEFGMRMGRVTHHVDNKEGFSLIPVGLLKDNVTWEYSPDSLSPGYYEFMRDGWLFEYDLSLFVQVDTLIHLSGQLFRVDARNLSADFAIINNQTAYRLFEKKWTSTNGFDSFTVFLPLETAEYRCQVSLSDTLVSWPVTLSGLWVPTGAITVTEIFPRATSLIPEWFELYNKLSISVNLKNWTLREPDGPDDTLSHEDLLIPPQTCIVFTSDIEKFQKSWSAIRFAYEPPDWLSLNNYRQEFTLHDNNGIPHERVRYDSDWFSFWDKQSLVRIDTNDTVADEGDWAVSETPTPGLPEPRPRWWKKDNFLSIGPKLFTPNGDNIDDFLSIRVGPGNAQVDVTIYGMDGLRYVTLPSKPVEQFLWDGRKQNGMKAPIGPFFVVADFVTGTGRKLIRKKGVLWR